MNSSAYSVSRGEFKTAGQSNTSKQGGFLGFKRYEFRDGFHLIDHILSWVKNRLISIKKEEILFRKQI